jgi:hypothetical protein
METLQTRERMPISVSEHAATNPYSSYARFRASSSAPSSLAPLATAGDPGLNLLARPLKVRLKRSSKCDATKVEDYGNSVVMIEPLAQFRAVEGFLYSRVKKKPVRLRQRNNHQMLPLPTLQLTPTKEHHHKKPLQVRRIGR